MRTLLSTNILGSLIPFSYRQQDPQSGLSRYFSDASAIFP